MYSTTVQNVTSESGFNPTEKSGPSPEQQDHFVLEADDSTMKIVKRLLLALTASSLLAVQAANLTCGTETYVDDLNNVCLCDTKAACSSLTTTAEDTTNVFIAGVFDTVTYDWGPEIFNFTVSLLNNHSNGFHDEVFIDGTVIEFEVANDACDDTTAARAYWNLRTENDGAPMHGVVGARCSGASIAIARIAGLEEVPQISPVSTSSRLSNDTEFPFFSRMVAPGDGRGEVGAVIALLRFFNWSRVSVLSTDTQYAKDTSADFRKLWEGTHLDEEGNMQWEGKVSYSNSIALDSTIEVDADSVRQVLTEVPTEDPAVNSRVILLVAQEEHAFSILQIAKNMEFQPDTIWIGLSWAGRDNPIGNEWLSEFPGYLGIAPFRNEDEFAMDYLDRLQAAQVAEGREPWKELHHYAIAYLVDSIVSLAKALSNVDMSDRHNGTAVTRELRSLSFAGVSGNVSFTDNGDRANPKYSIINYQKSQDGTFAWKDVGSTGTEINSVVLTSGVGGICFAKIGCNVTEAPSDSYPLPSIKLPKWVATVICIISALLVGLALKYWRSRRRKKTIKESMTAMQRKMEELQKIDDKLLDLDQEVEDANRKKNRLILERGALMEKPETWSDSDQILVEVNPDEDQYWTVMDRLRLTMNDAYISKLWRVQNTSLWSYYCFHKHRLSMNGIDTNESAVWHGTSSLDPCNIYSDRQDGFMMQYSRDGFWGRGIYFAEKSVYSHSYSYQPALRPVSSGQQDGRSVGNYDEREMFLAKVLIGNEVLINRDESPRKADECRALTVPPVNPKTSMKFNTVTGHTAGSQVWIVYENGRAYPDYLVRYYRGKRDPKRTPFKSKKEALQKKCQKFLMKKPAMTDSTSEFSDPDDLETNNSKSIGTGCGIDDAKTIWEFRASSGWEEYGTLHQAEIESAYKAFLVDPTVATVQIMSGQWTYEIDFNRMVQTNVQHPARMQRDIQRRPDVQPQRCNV